MSKYHKYVFDIEARKYIGAFNEMYAAEGSQGFDSWDQDNLAYLDKQVCLHILRNYEMESIVDVGCGKGTMTQVMKTNSNRVIGVDISSEAIAVARGRYRDIQFVAGDINEEELSVVLADELRKGQHVDCITCLETLSYLSNWQDLFDRFAMFGRYILIKLDIPENPIGFVKTKTELKTVFDQYYTTLEHIEFVDKNITILFGESRQNVGH